MTIFFFMAGKLSFRLNNAATEPFFADNSHVESFAISDDPEIKYQNIGDDFGPFDLSSIYRFCNLVEREMQVSSKDIASFMTLFSFSRPFISCIIQFCFPLLNFWLFGSVTRFVFAVCGTTVSKCTAVKPQRYSKADKRSVLARSILDSHGVWTW